ncbi:hypothetical protein [Nitrogeniibacter aestuarii]|uniref:hypothetical protein n=1 Tax=Nitrogeniibacter aestuarii TaxID=2815343 RepID=UPI001E2DB2F9|nr:hypothetical protein [Nitrogeniibacter aestuarii]
MIPTRASLPDDAAEWGQTNVSLPRLKNDSPSSCPETIDEIMAYIRLESSDVDDAKGERLSFLRTALVEKDQYWLWRYMESNDSECYVVFRIKADGSSDLGLSETNGLAPEHYLLADYYNEIYWP